MDRLDRLEQVVKNLNKAVKELQAEVKALKGEPSKAEQIKDLCDNAKVYHSDFSCALLRLMGGEYNNKKETV
jgi:hypothetical protein